MILSRVMTWISTIFRRFQRQPKVIRYEVPDTVTLEPRSNNDKPTKAYADQRQKAPWNRRRKSKKAMKNLYRL